MSWQDVATIAPFIGAVLVACAVLVVDIAWPGRRGPALLTALAGLAVVALLVLVTGRPRRPHSAGRIRRIR